MNLSPTGVLTEKFWCEIPDHFPHVQLGAYIVMPNHVHRILNFKTDVETLHRNVSVTKSIRPKKVRELHKSDPSIPTQEDPALLRD
jgi:hypothetical protein